MYVSALGECNQDCQADCIGTRYDARHFGQSFVDGNLKALIQHTVFKTMCYCVLWVQLLANPLSLPLPFCVRAVLCRYIFEIHSNSQSRNPFYKINTLPTPKSNSPFRVVGYNLVFSTVNQTETHTLWWFMGCPWNFRIYAIFYVLHMYLC